MEKFTHDGQEFEVRIVVANNQTHLRVFKDDKPFTRYGYCIPDNQEVSLNDLRNDELSVVIAEMKSSAISDAKTKYEQAKQGNSPS